MKTQLMAVKNNCVNHFLLDKHGKIVNGHLGDAYRDLGFDKAIVVNATP